MPMKRPKNDGRRGADGRRGSACPRPRWRHAALPLVLAALVVIPRGGAQAASTAAQREQRRQRIAAMSDAERARLKRNLARFQALPEAERKRIRELDAALAADQQAGGDLRRVMERYTRWLETLTPGQQEDLRKEADPQNRERLVLRLMKDQQERADPTGGRGGARGLSAKDLEAVMPLLEQTLVAEGELTQGELKDKSPLERHVRILEAAFPRNRPDRMQMPGWITESLVNEMAARVTNPRHSQLLAVNDPRQKAARMFGLVYGGVFAELLANKPNENDLEEFFVGLKGEEQDEVLRMPHALQQQVLARKYMEAHPEKYPRLPRMPEWLWIRPQGRGGRFPGGERPPADGADNPERRAPAPNDNRRRRGSERPSA